MTGEGEEEASFQEGSFFFPGNQSISLGVRACMFQALRLIVAE